MKRLEGKRAIVTGGAAGIGKAIVQQFVGEGAKVIIADIDFNAAELLARELQPNAKPFKLNVTSSDNFKLLVEFCENEFNGLDIFVNNA